MMLSAGARSCAVARPAQGSGLGTRKAAVPERTSGQPAKRASTNQVMLPGGTEAVRLVAAVVPTSCAAAPSTVIHTSYPTASGDPCQEKVIGEAMLPLGGGVRSGAGWVLH